MANFDTAREVLETSASSAGSAMREHGKWMQSLDARINTLKASWQSLSQTFLSSDFLKVGIDGVTGLVDVLDGLIQTLGTLGTIGLGIGIFNLLKNGKTVLAGIKQFSTLFSFGMSTAQGFSEKLSMVGLAAQDAGKGIVKYFTSSLSGAVTGIGLLVAGIGLAVNLYKNYKEAISEARQETIRASDEFLDSTSSFEQAYIKYSGRTDLTADEESELKSAIKGTVDALDDKSSALQNVVNSSNDYLASLERIADEEKKEAERAAKAKRDAAKAELEDSITNIWRGSGKSVYDIVVSDKEAKKLAEGLSYYGEQIQAGKNSIYGLTLNPNADANEIVDYYYELVEYQERLSDADLVDSDEYERVTASIDKMSESVKTYTDGVYDAAKAQYQLANGIPKTVDEYLKMRESILTSDDIKDLSFDTKNIIANTLDSEYGQLFDLSSAEVQARKFIGLIQGYGNGTKDGSNEIGTVETFLNMRTAVNNNECTVGDYLAQFDEIDSMTKKWSDREKEEFNLAFGIDSDSIKEQYEDVYNYLSRKYLNKDTRNMDRDEEYSYRLDVKENKKKIEEFLNGLSADELKAVVDIKTEIDWENTSFEDIRKQIEKQAQLNKALNFTIAIDVETESIEALNTAMAESVSGVGLSSESIDALKGRYAELASQGYDLSAMFEETSNGIHLNKAAVSELEQTLASQKLAETDDKLDILKNRYDELTTEIDNCTDASERASLYAEQQTIVQKINDLSTLAAQYKGLTSAYNAWQNAESAGQERDMYESIIEGFENIGDEISRGWYDDGTIKFLELITGQTDLAGKSASELKEIWNSLDDTIKGTSYSVKDFFTTDDEGNSTSTGAYNFLRAVEELGDNGILKALKGKNIEDLIVRNDKGNIVEFDFDVVGGDKAVADALGISEEMVQIIQRTLDDAGFVVTLDGKYTLLADLKTSAEEANDTLKRLKTEGLENLKNISEEDLDFDFDASSLTALNDEFAKANKVLDQFKDKNGQLKKDAKGNLVEGAQEALDIAMYYQATIDKLTEPAYMQLETNQVEENLREPLEKMQEFGDLVKEKHMLTLTGDTEGLEETEQKMNEIVDYIYENDDLKAKLEIEGLSKEEIKSKLEKGEIEIPATVDIQLEMSEDIKDMRLMMMNQLGLISDEQLKLEIEYGVDYSAVEEYTPEQQKAVVEYFAEHDEVDNYTPEEKKAIVKLVAEKDDIDNWSDKEVHATVKYFVDDSDLDKWSPEEKRAFAKYIADGNDVSNYTPEEKKAIAKYIADGGNVDGYTPEDKKALAKYLVDGGDPANYVPPSKKQKVKADLDSSEPDNKKYSEKTQPVKASLNSSAVDNYKPPEKTMTIWAKIKKKASDLWDKITGGGSVDGTAHVDGTAFVGGTINKTPIKKSGKAFKQGNWGTKDSGIALGGEEAPELLVRNGKWHLIGEKGAEFFGYRKGDIIFNASQTKEIFEKGKITHGNGRGKALVSGTAFSSGSGGGSEPEVTSYVVGTNKVTGETYTKSTDDAKDDFEETFDWIETAIERIERDISNLDRTANSAYKSWSERNKALASEISKVNKEINLQEQAYQKYMSAANAVGLSSSWANKVKNGAIDIDTITDETLVDKIQDYQKYYQAALDCKDKIEELKETEAELYQQKFDNVITRYDGILDDIEHQKDIIEEYMSQYEGTVLSDYVAHDAKSYQKIASYYQQLIKQEQLSIVQLEKEKAELIAKLNEAVANGISKNSEAYNEMQSQINDIELQIQQANTSIIEGANNISQSYVDAFDNIIQNFENTLSVIEYKKNMIEEGISQSEAQGWLVSEKYYETLASNERKNIAKLQQEKTALLSQLQNAMANGSIEKGSQAWYDMCLEIDNVTLAIEQSNTALLEYQQTLQQLDWEVFDLLQDRISSVTEESEFLIELMSNKKLYEDNGQLTNEGKATMGLHGVNYNVYMHQADLAAEEAARIKKELASDPYDTELEAHYREMISLQQEYILAAEDEKNAIRDMVENGIEYELDALQEKIDLYNEALKSQRDLYDYQKRVSEQTKNIASLQKQLNAYQGDTSEESRAKIQELKVELEEAQNDLQETEYDKYISDTEALLDNLYNQYELILNTRLDNIDALMSEMIAEINSDASVINSTITESADAVGYTISDSMQTIWDSSTASINGVITMYGEQFSSAQTSTNAALSEIKNSMSTMISQLNSIASQKIAEANKSSATESKEANTKPKTETTKSSTTTTKSVTTTPTTSSKTETSKTGTGNGKPEIGDKVTFLSGEYYYSSDGLTPKGSKYHGKEVYITNINTRSWATHPYHISTGKTLGSGDLGWLKKNQISGYATGKKKITNNELAWTQENGQEYIIRPSDGAILTPIAKGDSILNAQASGNIWQMANTPAEFIKDNLNLGTTNIPNNSTVQSSYTQNLDKVVFNLPNVKNYDEMLDALQKDKNFERLITAMTINKLAGGSSLAKGKAIR